MQRTKIQCTNCNRLISKSNLGAHQRSCLNMTDAVSMVLREGTRAGGLLSAARRLEQKQIKIKDSIYPFEFLTVEEKRSRILHEQHDKCDMCAIPQIWNSKPLKFDLDHIDGDRQNNTRNNLRLICPNCHSQTPTYKVGNNKNPGKIQYSTDQIIAALKSNDSAYKAMKSLGMNPHGGNYTRLRNIVKKSNLKLLYSF